MGKIHIYFVPFPARSVVVVTNTRRGTEQEPGTTLWARSRLRGMDGFLAIGYYFTTKYGEDKL